MNGKIGFTSSDEASNFGVSSNTAFTDIELDVISEYRKFSNVTPTVIDSVRKFVVDSYRYCRDISGSMDIGSLIVIAKKVSSIPVSDDNLTKQNINDMKCVLDSIGEYKSESTWNDVVYAMHGRVLDSWQFTKELIDKRVKLEQKGLPIILSSGWDFLSGGVRKSSNIFGGTFGYRGDDLSLLYKLYSILPKHKRYIELYAGYGLFWLKSPSVDEIIIEPDNNMSLLYRYIRRLDDDDIENLVSKNWIGSFELFNDLNSKMDDRNNIVDYVYRQLYVRRFGLFEDDTFIFNRSEENVHYDFLAIVNSIKSRIISMSVRSSLSDSLFMSKDNLIVINTLNWKLFDRPDSIKIDSSATANIIIVSDKFNVVKMEGNWNVIEVSNDIRLFTNYVDRDEQYSWAGHSSVKKNASNAQGKSSYVGELFAVAVSKDDGKNIDIFSKLILSSENNVLCLERLIKSVLSDDNISIGDVLSSDSFANAPIGVFDGVEVVYKDVGAIEPILDCDVLGDDVYLHMVATGLITDTDCKIASLAKAAVVWGVQEGTSGLCEFFIEFDNEKFSNGRWLLRKCSDGSFEVGMPSDQSPALFGCMDDSDTLRIVKSIGGNGNSINDIVRNDTLFKILQSVDYPYLPTGNTNSMFVRLVVNKSVDDTEEHIAYGVVLEPEEIDFHKDVISADEIRSAAHRFMEIYGGSIGVQHRFKPNGLQVLESYIAPDDFVINDRNIKRGTWLIVVRITNDAVWKRVKLGLTNPEDPQAFTGFSVQGVATVQNLQH